jgi:hypothetical protein
MAVVLKSRLPSHSAFTTSGRFPACEQRQKSNWKKTDRDNNGPGRKPGPVRQGATFSACNACHSNHLLAICIVLSSHTANKIANVVLELTVYIACNFSECCSDASCIALPNICMTREIANTTPPGLKYQARRNSKCKTEFKECNTPHPGHGMWRNVCIRQKCGSRIRTGDMNKASKVDSRTPRWG